MGSAETAEDKAFVSVEIDTELLALIEAHALERSDSRSEWIREAVVRRLRDEPVSQETWDDIRDWFDESLPPEPPEV